MVMLEEILLYQKLCREEQIIWIIFSLCVLSLFCLYSYNVVMQVGVEEKKSQK